HCPALIKCDKTLGHPDTSSADPSRSDDAVRLLSPCLKPTRPTHFTSLSNLVPVVPARLFIMVGKQSGHCAPCTAGGWVFRDTTERSEHASANIHTVVGPRVGIKGCSQTSIQQFANSLEAANIGANTLERAAIPKFRHHKRKAN